LALRPAVFDRHVLALDKAGFLQALEERNVEFLGVIRAIREDPDHRRRPCCARAAIGHAAAVPPRSVMSLRRFMSPPKKV
jgi:hypothetical protein